MVSRPTPVANYYLRSVILDASPRIFTSLSFSVNERRFGNHLFSSIVSRSSIAESIYHEIIQPRRETGKRENEDRPNYHRLCRLSENRISVRGRKYRRKLEQEAALTIPFLSFLSRYLPPLNNDLPPSVMRFQPVRLRVASKQPSMLFPPSRFETRLFQTILVVRDGRRSEARV